MHIFEVLFLFFLHPACCVVDVRLHVHLVGMCVQVRVPPHLSLSLCACPRACLTFISVLLIMCLCVLSHFGTPSGASGAFMPPDHYMLTPHTSDSMVHKMKFTVWVA